MSTWQIDKEKIRSVLRIAGATIRRFCVRGVLAFLVALGLWFFVPYMPTMAPTLWVIAAGAIGFAIGLGPLAIFTIIALALAAWEYQTSGVLLAEYYMRVVYYFLLLSVGRELLGRMVRRSAVISRVLDKWLALETVAYDYVMRFVEAIPRYVKQWALRLFAYIKTIPIQIIASAKSGQLWVILVGAVLFIIPFFWFKNGNGDFGGDSSRLYFYDPLSWMKSMALFEISSNSYGVDNPNFFMVPFLALLAGIKILLGKSGIQLLSVFNGMLLAGAFLSMYLVVVELLHRAPDKKNIRIAGVFAGLFFICSQIILFNWQKSLYSFHQIAIYPLLFWLLLRYINRKNLLYLGAGLCLTVIFSVSFSLGGVPSFSAFFPGALLWLFFYAVMEKKTILFVGGIVFFVVGFLGLHAFHLFPQIMSIANPESSIYSNLFTKGGQIDRGLGYFDGVRRMVEPMYNLVGFHQYGLYTQTGVSNEVLSMLRTYGVKIISLFFVFPIILISAFWLRAREQVNRQTVLFLTLFMWFLVMLFFMTASYFGAPGLAFYRSLFSVPGFSIFRSFYGVFAIPFMMVYAFTFGVAFYTLLNRISRRSARYMLNTSVLLLLCYSAIPMIRGSMVNIAMNDTKDVSLANQFNENFETILYQMQAHPLDQKLLTLPLVNADYQIVDGRQGGAYVGPSPFGLLGGKNVFSGLQSFDFGTSTIFNQGFFFNAITNHDYRTVSRLLSLMNVGFIFNNENPYVYRDRFIGWPYSQAIWRAFPTTQSFSDLVKALGYEPFNRIGTYAMHYNPSMMQPRLFVPQRIDVVPSEKEFQDLLVHSNEWSPRWAVFEKNMLTEAIPGLVSKTTAAPPSVEFAEINSVRYEITIRNIRGPFPLLFTQAYHNGWRLHPVLPPRERCQGTPRGSGSSHDLTWAPEAQQERWCESQRITTVGVGYVSEEYQGTIQNQNLTRSNFDVRTTIDGAHHVRANTYANAWWIDMNTYPQHLIRKNQDGSAEITLTLAFAPQQNFYTGVVISISSFLVIILGFVGKIVWVRLRKPNRVEENIV